MSLSLSLCLRTHTEEMSCEETEKVANCNITGVATPGIEVAGTLILDFQYPEL